MIQRVEVPAGEKPDRVRSSVIGREVYEAWLRMKAEDPALTQRQAADRLGLNLTQVKNALARQRRARRVMRRRGHYRDWQSD